MARVPLNRSVLLHPIEQLLGKNLGENGTGIRKISTTQAPLVIPTTVTVPSVHVPSNGKDRMEIPISPDYEESMELPDIDQDHLNQTLRQHYNISVVKNVRNIF